MTARDDVLRRIRTALADRPEPAPVVRDYRCAGDDAGDVELFADRVANYRATVHRNRPVDEILRERGVDAIVVPDGFPDAWLPTVRIVREPVDVHVLDEVGSVVTTCAVAVASTGTIVLDAGAGQGSRALSLVPDHHLVVVRAEQVMVGVPEALAVLDPTRPLTWISGPSATSDIELDRVEGVHGPRVLDVLIID